MAHGRPEEALRILRQAAVMNGKHPLETFPEGLQFIEDPLEEHGMHSLSCLFQKEWRTTTLTIWGVWAGQPFLYWGTILLVTLVFSDTQDLKDDQTYSFDYAAIFASSVAEVVVRTPRTVRSFVRFWNNMI